MKARRVVSAAVPRGRPHRWLVLAGLVCGVLGAVVAFAPASWLARAVAQGTGGHLLLADARGSIWTGSAVAVLTGGPDSRDAAILPGRLEWKLRHAPGSLAALELRAVQPCCLDGELRLRLEPGVARLHVSLPPERRAIGAWPAGWLAGLGTPWNTLQLEGALLVVSEGLTIDAVQGHWRVSGRAELNLLAVSSALSTLDPLGSYRLGLGPSSGGGDGLALNLQTLDGALRLGGSGQWSANGLRFRGQATAQPGAEAALSNLLNIIGRRQGNVAHIAIG